MCSGSVGFDFESFHKTSFLKIKLSLFRFAPPIFFSEKGKEKRKKESCISVGAPKLSRFLEKILPALVVRSSQ